MPLYWKYLLRHFASLFFGATLAFITVFLVTRLEDIAKVAATGAPLGTLFLYTLLQIPYMLPIVLPLSVLIASFLLFSQLSKNHELTAFRSSGMSLGRLLAPLLWLSIFIACLNFYVSSELATTSHLKSRQISSQLSQINPLLFLQDKKLLKYQNTYVEMLSSFNKDHLQNLILCSYHEKNNSLNLIRAKSLRFEKQQLHGEKVSLVNVLKADQKEGFDHLVIENQYSMNTQASHLNLFIRPSGFKLSNDHLSLPLLLAKQKAIREKMEGHPRPDPEHRFDLAQTHSEVVRRFSLGLAPLSFCMLGSTFSMTSHRQQSKKPFYLMCLLTASFLIFFFIAKNLDKNLTLVLSLHSLGHLILWLPSLYFVSIVNRGER